jgi:V/A-type H+-transporting ATPase subunit I
MRLRPAQAHWFETYVPRAASVRASAVLAATGAVQLERDPRLAPAADLDRLRYYIDRFRSLAAEHARDLPRPGGAVTALAGDPVRLAEQALHRLRLWSARVDSLKSHLEQLQEELGHLEPLADYLESLHARGDSLPGLFRATPFLCKCLFACPPGRLQAAGLGTGRDHQTQGKRHDFLYVADLPERRPAIRAQALSLGCRQLAIPAWLGAESGPAQLQARLAHTRDDATTLTAELKALRHDPDIARARADIATLHWYLEHAAAYLGGGELCHLTGWTRAQDPGSLQRALRQASIEAVVRFPRPPLDTPGPVTLLDTWWTRPFLPLLALWGTPGRTEVDPSALLAVIVPLLFGYMFPDLGHGLLLMLVAGLAWRRHPRLRFLLPCGLAAAGFGLLSGEVFGLHGLLPALWLHPLDDPLRVLAIPLLFGFGLMLLGLCLAGLEAGWRGELRAWLLRDGAVLLLYLTVPLSLAWPQAVGLAAWALLQYGLASLALAAPGRRVAGLLQAAGALLLSLFELAMNTLSFLRVGAFALAHAALSYAVLTLADSTASTWAWILVMVLGNLFAVVMEGLLVFVQTTRLVLFEFFLRFLSADGRLFRPLPPPRPPQP